MPHQNRPSKSLKNSKLANSFNLEKSVEREKDMQEIDVHGEIKITVVIAMDGEYAGNAGAISCHLIGEERIFDFIRRIKILYRLS